MSENISTKSLALFISNNTITFLTKTIQQKEIFYSEAATITLGPENKILTEEEVKETIISHLPLLLYYDNIIVCYHTDVVTIVPYKHYNKDLIDKYLLFPETDFSFSVSNCNTINANIIFSNRNIVHQILTSLPNYKNAFFTHTSNILINTEKINTQKIQIFVQLINQKLELCIYNKGIFTLYNLYNLIGDEDVIYHIINVMQQLELDPTQVEIVFENGITKEHIAYKYLPKYVQSISYNENAEQLGAKYLLYKIFECE